MKKAVRYAAVLPVVAPFVMFVHGAGIFLGRERSVRLCAPFVTGIALRFLKLAIPNIGKPEEFDRFRTKLKENFWMWSPLYDFEVEEETSDLIRLNIWNCPFCELFSKAGLPEMNRHVCQGDWALAGENGHLWGFERTREIGKGDRLCDHTYKRLA